MDGVSLGWDLALVAVGLVLLFAGGEGLVRGSTAIADRFGLSKLVVGLVIVGFGTSAPELLVSVQAALGGSPDISVGNVVGSNIANVLLIIGVAAIISPVLNEDPSIRRDLFVSVAASFAIWGLFTTGTIDRSAGIALFAALLVYVGASYGMEVRRKSAADGTVSLETEEAGLGPALSIVAIVVGVAMLVFGARFMVDGATGLARDLGVSEAIIGLTIVAIGTSLPELATAVIAARKNEAGFILGNVVGSSIFNILCILGITAIITPIAVAPRFAAFDGPLMIAIFVVATIYLFAFKRIGRTTGVALLVLYGAYLLVQNAI